MSSTNATVSAPVMPMHDPKGGLIVALNATLRRDLTLMLRRRGEVLNPLVFFALVITLLVVRRSKS